MASDDILNLILEMLRRLESRLNQQEESARLALSHGRPTEQFPKIELAISRAIESHMEKCAAASKERMGERLDPILKKIEKVEIKVDEIKKDLGGKINGVKDEATKTATGSVVPLTEKVNLLADTLKGTQGEPGLEEMVRDLGQWVEAEEARRTSVAERSKFNLTTWLTVIGILVAIGLGLAGIFLGK